MPEKAPRCPKCNGRIIWLQVDELNPGSLFDIVDAEMWRGCQWWVSCNYREPAKEDLAL